jgi:two-component system sensor histidine kinase AlgZ
MQLPRPEHTPQTPLDALWRAPVIVSVLVAAEGVAAVLALTPGAEGNRWAYFGLASLAAQWIALITLGALYLFRHLLARIRPQPVVWFALLSLLLSTWVVGAVGWVTLHEIFDLDQNQWLTLFLRMTSITAIVGLLGLMSFLNHWRAQQMALRAKQFELEALQARIHPHFLFNTLNTGAALVHLRPADAEQLLLDLADLFRAALAGPQQILLADELALTRRYLEIEALRFGQRLQVDWQLPDALPQVMIPALSVQPLVENAIRHGIEPNPGGGNIHLQVAQNNNWLEISVHNPLPISTTQTHGHRIGLDAVRARIQAMSHGHGQLETRQENGGYVAVIRLPALP